MTAVEVIAELERLRSDTELAKVRKRLPPGEAAIGVRMRDLFDTAKAHEAMALDEVSRLLDHPAYEPRMAAFCILDFKARKRLDDQRPLPRPWRAARPERGTRRRSRAAPRA